MPAAVTTLLLQGLGGHKAEPRACQCPVEQLRQACAEVRVGLQVEIAVFALIGVSGAGLGFLIECLVGRQSSVQVIRVPSNARRGHLD